MTNVAGFGTDGTDLVPLGDGPVARVLAGVRAQDGAAYAVKVFPGRLDRRAQAEVKGELTRLAELRHAAALLVPDETGELPDGRFALRMELCAQSLNELIGAFGPLSVPDTLALGEALAWALTAAHRSGLVHGSVTPGNVLFRPSGEPVLSDFGLTLRRAFPCDPSRIVDYVAPETLRDGTADERTDLYGLGAVLYLALTGSSPHRGMPGVAPGDRVLQVLRSPVPALNRTGLPGGLAQLVLALLAKDPHARPVNASEVAERLGTMLGPTPAPVGDGHGGQARTPANPAPPPPAAPPVFDDFAVAASARPSGDPVVTFGPDRKRRRATPVGLIVAVICGLCLVAVTGAVLLLSSPHELAVPRAQAQVGAPNSPLPPPREVRLELGDPVDRGNFVVLTWESAEPLNFAVVVAAEGADTKVLLAQRNHTYRVPVDPAREYCFLIQGTDGTHVYESAAKPIRGAVCKQ